MTGVPLLTRGATSPDTASRDICPFTASRDICPFTASRDICPFPASRDICPYTVAPRVSKGTAEATS
jgi:ribosome modulation factor